MYTFTHSERAFITFVNAQLQQKCLCFKVTPKKILHSITVCIFSLHFMKHELNKFLYFLGEN